MYKNLYLLFLGLIFLMQESLAQRDSVPTRKVYTTSRAASAPKIDGILNDLTWVSVPLMTDFKQKSPVYGTDCSQNMEVKIVYDNAAVYIGARLYDSHCDSIACQLGNRDGEVNADLFDVKFDTYNTEQDAFIFGLSASGVQFDSRFTDGLYNAVWESSVKIDSLGWVVEMKIPFSALRFPNKDVQLWGLQITRKINRNGEFDQWGLLPNGVSNFYKYWGLLKGIENIKQPIRLSLIHI
jgi:hypothetical protein